jgi:hypothetical protein
MKKIIGLAFVAASLAACSDNQADNATLESGDTISSPTVTTEPAMDNTGDTSSVTTNSTTTTYTPAEGDVTYREKKVRVMRNSQWVDADKDVTLDNGTVVYRDGRVKREDREIRLNEGEVVTRTGNFFDKTGRAIENAWDATKDGAKKAGKAVGNAAEKVGEKAKKAVTDEDDHKDH